VVERYRQWLKEAGERSGVDVFTHLLRHTRATDLARAHTDTRTMMAVFDWKDPRMVDRYAAPYEPHVRRALALPIPRD
jgi:integrase